MIYRTKCCGLREYSGLRSTPHETMKVFAKELFGGMVREDFRTTRVYIDGTYYLFSGTTRSVVKDLAKFIEDEKLGKVYKTGYKTNPNSGNRLMVFIFEPNKKKLRKWYARNYKVKLQPLKSEGSASVFQTFDIEYPDFDDYATLTALGLVWFLISMVLGVLLIKAFNYQGWITMWIGG